MQFKIVRWEKKIPKEIVIIFKIQDLRNFIIPMGKLLCHVTVAVIKMEKRKKEYILYTQEH